MLASLTCKQISSSHSFRYGSLRYCRLWTENWKRGSRFRIHAIITHQGEEKEELTRERRMRWISAISRDDVTELSFKMKGYLAHISLRECLHNRGINLILIGCRLLILGIRRMDPNINSDPTAFNRTR